MPRTPDRFPGIREDEGIDLEPSLTSPAQPGQVRYHEGVFKFQDATQLIVLAPAGTPDFSKILFGLDGSFTIDNDGEPFLLL